MASTSPRPLDAMPGDTLPQYALASHVRACACDHQVILLDLRLNRYLGVGRMAAQALAPHVLNWPVRPMASNEQLGAPAAEPLLHHLCAQGLMQASPDLDSPPTGAVFPPPLRVDPCLQEADSTIDLEGCIDQTPTATRARQALRFTREVATAACWLRWGSLHAIANALGHRRARLTQRLGPRSQSIEAMKTYVVVHERLRPLFFTSRAQCLLDSLTLVRFLAADGLMPRWVVGVKTAPFGAHAWVQCGSTVLNDQHEHVREFRPILVV